jgi:acetoin utilization deacetylase AcuC-like enzyme
MSRALEDVADKFAGGRIVSLLEGGYHPEATAAAAVEHVRILARGNEMV